MGKIPRLLMGQYELGKLLGKGSFAKVYRARKVKTGEEMAIKIMDKNYLARSGTTKQQVMREIDIMRRVRHPHIVRIHEVMATKKSIFVVMEFVGGGSLYTYVLRHASRGIGEASARRVFRQLVSALDYCHSLGVYHRDIKPENILVDNKGDIKVADFGLSALMDTEPRQVLLHTVCGTPMFIAPEVFLHRGYDGAKADVWACGVLLFTLVAGHFPFNRRGTSMYYMIRHYAPWFSAGLVRFVRRLLCPDPVRRITIPQIKETLWFKKGFKVLPRSLSEPGQCNFGSGSNNDSTMSLMSKEDLSYPVARAQHHGHGSHMHTSASAPSLTTRGSTGSAAVLTQLRMRRPRSLNAFDLIASSPSLDLSGLFEEPGEQMRFVSAAPVAKIISKLEIAGNFSFMAHTKEYHVSIDVTMNGNSKSALLICANIFEFTPELVMVKVRKKAGDTIEYQEFCDNQLKPSLYSL
ncbi:hypothetical protein BS78_09G227300 [Paspalum vaginatum]|nr:hypothetical protein BS78_09G227300 [Paspalum vaginatum]